MTDSGKICLDSNKNTPPVSVPATEAQKEIWVSCQMGSGASCAYNGSFSIRLRGPHDALAIEEAIRDVTSRHQALWARFSPDGEYMTAGEQKQTTVPVIDLGHFSPEDRATKIAETLSEEVSVPFDLETGPLWRAKIAVLSSQECLIVFTAHHIVCDGWSIGILTRELGLCYSARRNGVEPVLDNAGSFFSYAQAQHSFSQTTRAAEVQNYWVRQFSGSLPTLELPVDDARPPKRSYDASCAWSALDAGLAEAVRKHAADAGASSFSVLLGAFAVLLQKLSGNEDIVIGVPVAGQGFSSNPNVVGHCVSMLPLRVRVDPAGSFSAIIAGVQDKLLDSYDHYEFTFGSLIKTLNIPRDLSRIPLIPVGFTHSKGLSSGELGFKDLHASFSMSKRLFETFELYVSASETPEGFTLTWHFNTDLFSDETVGRWQSEYELLLRNALSSPSSAIASLPILTVDDRTTLLTKWNVTERTYPVDSTVVELFERRARVSPESKAVECRDRSLTYKELDMRSTALAARLAEMGAGVETTVGICLERSLDMVVAIMGALKAGAAYVPLDPAYPEERISYIVTDSGARCLVTQSSFGPRFAKAGVTTLFIDELAFSDQALLRSVKASPDNIAYIIYTSGSTGKPKGVEIRHRSLTNFLCSMQDQPGMGPADSLLSVTTISFDIAGLELLLPLTAGGRVCIAESEIVADGKRLAESIALYRPTIMQATPSTWTLLLDSGWSDGKGLTILCGGEAMTRTLADRLLATEAIVWNMYGPTETTIWSSLWRVEAGRRMPPIGYPIANTQLYVLGEDLSPVPLGVSGELCIAGWGLARGYHNRPELTNEKFIDDPFAHLHGTPGERRMYKTGDMARRLSDGSIVVLGRTDFQVKIRGFRIELGEIESTLSAHPGIRECVVIDKADSSGSRSLVAYVAFRDAMSVPVDVLYASLRSILPFYMLPTQFVFIASVPRLTNGKVNRAALPEPDHDRPKLSMHFVAPRTDTERSLAAIWSAVLGVKDFGVLDNFFDLGGHSMAMASVHIKVQDSFKRHIDLVTLFEFPTIRSLAEYLEKESSDTIHRSAIENRANRQKAALSLQKKRARR